ncbi:hypothetical protein BDW75DRAFT_201039 [Aspergillus navahoensis]
MSGNTKNILGNPLSAVAWLVNRLAEYDIGFKSRVVHYAGELLGGCPDGQGWKMDMHL